MMRASAVTFECHVIGLPAPQGSKTNIGGGRMIESSRSLKPWRETVAAQVHSAMVRERFHGFEPHAPVELDLAFALRRPASLPKRVHLHARKPDLDKLARAVMDSCTASGLLHDDAQVFRLAAEKVYAERDYPMGVLIVARCWIGAG